VPALLFLLPEDVKEEELHSVNVVVAAAADVVCCIFNNEVVAVVVVEETGTDENFKFVECVDTCILLNDHLKEPNEFLFIFYIKKIFTDKKSLYSHRKLYFSFLN
jgi:hypothetical protein